MSFAKRFESLARRIGRASEQGDRFAHAARSAIDAEALHRGFELNELMCWAATADLPKQEDPDNSFGQPPITVWRGDGFYIDVLIWFEGTTVIHEHSFRGSFSVLCGSSIHARYEFAESKRLGDGARFGGLDRVGVEVLTPGDSRCIEPGPSGLIHSLFHLDHPSASLVVRTPGDPAFRPQLEYRMPGIGFDPRVRGGRDFDALIVLLRTSSERFDDAATTFLPEAPATIAYRLLEHAALAGIAGARLATLIAAATRLVGDSAANQRCVSHSLERVKHQRNIVARRGAITNADHRFLLAALLLLDNRASILEAVGQRHHGCDPVDLLLDWLGAMSAQNALGVELDEVALVVLEAMLRGGSEADVVAAGGDPIRVAKLWLTLPMTRLLAPLIRP